jgi:predicted RecB family nuclease
VGHPITASMLYDLVTCPHRVTMDLFADPSARDDVSPFVQLLWERGTAFERQVVGELDKPFIDLSRFSGIEKEHLTLQAMDRGEPLIYGGRITTGDLLGEPDLLRKEGSRYVAGDIKSGLAEEGANDENDGKPKKRYAVQLALYTDILEQIGRSTVRRAFIWGINREETPYDFMELYGARNPHTLWDDYQECLQEARQIATRTISTLPAYGSATCKQCVWYSTCLKELQKSDDLTLIPELGRAKRDTLSVQFHSIREFSEIDPVRFIQGTKTIFTGIGPATLYKFHERAKLLTRENGQAYLRAPLALPISRAELFFDIEVDPMRDICYLHGFIERRDGKNESERYIPFFATENTSAAEEQAFAAAWHYIRTSQPCTMYYYSKYERTIYRKLRKKYPSICTEDEIEELFRPEVSVDLYCDVVLKATEWPTRDFSMKTLATYLGFSWRDLHPSGAASIEWFHRWTETGDKDIRTRILDYNEDDCRATRVLLDAIKLLPFGVEGHRRKTEASDKPD